MGEILKLWERKCQDCGEKREKCRSLGVAYEAKAKKKTKNKITVTRSVFQVTSASPEI